MGREWCTLVKGTSRRVIVVDAPDTDLFEQAIFIVRNDVLSDRGITAQQIVDEACRVARSYGRTHGTRGRAAWRDMPFLWGAIGAGGIGLIWLITALI